MASVKNVGAGAITDAVAVVAIGSTAALAWHGTVSATDFQGLVILCLGYVFGRNGGATNTSGS